jgi:hypothetical protein
LARSPLHLFREEIKINNAPMKLPLALLLSTLCVLLSTLCHAERLHPESHYRDMWCKENFGKAEVTLPDRTRADCLTESYAVEIEFADKWKSGIGQSLWYAMQTGKKAAIVLVIEKTVHNKYWIRLNSVIVQYKLPIQAFRVGP